MLKYVVVFSAVCAITFGASAVPQKGGGSTPPADPAIVYIKNGVNGRHELYAMNADGTNAASVLQGTAGTIWNISAISLSPNGQSVAFAGYTYNTSYHIRVLDISVQAGKPVGSNLRTIFTTPQSNWTFYPQWSPTSDEIAFIHRGPEGLGIYTIPVSGGTPDLAFGLPSGYEINNFAWSPDGTKFVVVGLRMMYTVDRATGSVETMLQTTASPYRFAFPSWGRTTNRIAYSLLNEQLAGPEAWNVYMIDAAGASAPQLVKSAAYMPVWSPDDAKIAYVPRANKAKVSMITLATGAVKVLSPTTTDVFPDWRRF